MQIIASELEYGLHGVGVATGELASAKAVSEGTKKNVYVQEKVKLSWEIVIGFLGIDVN